MLEMEKEAIAPAARGLGDFRRKIDFCLIDDSDPDRPPRIIF
jgi:hypothetical protein